jgi:hypothetical protein
MDVSNAAAALKKRVCSSSGSIKSKVPITLENSDDALKQHEKKS